jgi:hypothetical protein
MLFSIRRAGLVLAAALIALGTGTVLASPAQALTGWSPPVQLPGACGASLAVNAAGTEVAAGSQQNPDNTVSVQACTSADGQTWSVPVTLGQGYNPAVAIAPDGRVVAVWRSTTDAGVSASVRPPGGQWGPAVTVTTDPYRDLGVGIDGSGNAIAAWMTGTSAVQTASLPAGARKWTKITTLATRGQAVDLAVNATGSAIITWATGAAALAASGTVLGGFAAPVTLGPPPGYPIGHTRVVLNGQGDAAAAWVASGGVDRVATRSPDGSWAPSVTLSTTSSDGRIDVAIDGAGDARAIFGQLSGTDPNFFSVAYTSARPAGGTWSTPALLSAPGDATASPHVVADAAGTFVASWVDKTTGLTVLTSPPSGGFGPATTFAGASGDLKIAPGYAVLSFTSNPGPAMSVSTEPVS